MRKCVKVTRDKEDPLRVGSLEEPYHTAHRGGSSLGTWSLERKNICIYVNIIHIFTRLIPCIHARAMRNRVYWNRVSWLRAHSLNSNFECSFERNFRSHVMHSARAAISSAPAAPGQARAAVRCLWQPQRRPENPFRLVGGHRGKPEQPFRALWSPWGPRAAPSRTK